MEAAGNVDRFDSVSLSSSSERAKRSQLDSIVTLPRPPSKRGQATVPRRQPAGEGEGWLPAAATLALAEETDGG